MRLVLKGWKIGAVKIWGNAPEIHSQLSINPMELYCPFVWKVSKKLPLYTGHDTFKKKEKLDKDGLLALTIIWDVLCNFVKFAQFKKREKDPCRSVTLSKVAGLSLQLHQKWHCTKGGFHAFWNCANGTKSRNA